MNKIIIIITTITISISKMVLHIYYYSLYWKITFHSNIFQFIAITIIVLVLIINKYMRNILVLLLYYTK